MGSSKHADFPRERPWMASVSKKKKMSYCITFWYIYSLGFKEIKTEIRSFMLSATSYMKPTSLGYFLFVCISRCESGCGCFTTFVKSNLWRTGSMHTGVNRDNFFTVLLLQSLAGGSYLPCSPLSVRSWNAVHRNPAGGKSLQHDAVTNAFWQTEQ